MWEECTTLPSAMQLQILQILRKLKQLLSSVAVGDSPTGNNATQEYGLHVLVKGSRRYFLIDSGSAISVIPTSFIKHQVQPGLLKLYAANAADIDTYGEVNLELHLNLRRSLKWNFVIPNVQSSITGADLSHLTMDSSLTSRITGSSTQYLNYIKLNCIMIDR
jgi:hypothetical protein